MAEPAIDYDALARQHGAVSSAPDYDTLAKQYGATSSVAGTPQVTSTVRYLLAPDEAQPTTQDPEYGQYGHAGYKSSWPGMLGRMEEATSDAVNVMGEGLTSLVHGKTADEQMGGASQMFRGFLGSPAGQAMLLHAIGTQGLLRTGFGLAGGAVGSEVGLAGAQAFGAGPGTSQLTSDITGLVTGGLTSRESAPEVLKGGITGAWQAAREPGVLPLKIKGVPVQIEIPGTPAVVRSGVKGAGIGAGVGGIVGGVPGAKAGGVVGGVIGAAKPIVTGAIRGMREALAGEDGAGGGPGGGAGGGPSTPPPPGTPTSPAPGPAAPPMTPGQAYAASQGIDWGSLNANDQAMLEHAARAQANAAAQPAPAPAPPAAPPAAEPVPPPATPPPGASPRPAAPAPETAAPVGEPNLEQQLAESIQQAQARKTPPSFEEKARGQKVDKLFSVVKAQNMPLAMLNDFGEAASPQWKMLADFAKVNPPSETAIARLKQLVADYEASRNVPITGTTTPAEAQAAFEQARATRRGAVPEHVDAILNAIPRVKYAYAKTFTPADWAALEDAAGTGETSPATRDAILEGIRQRELPPKK